MQDGTKCSEELFKKQNKDTSTHPAGILNFLFSTVDDSYINWNVRNFKAIGFFKNDKLTRNFLNVVGIYVKNTKIYLKTRRKRIWKNLDL